MTEQARETARKIVAGRGDTICNRRGCNLAAERHGFVDFDDPGAAAAFPDHPGHYDGGYCPTHIRDWHYDIIIEGTRRPTA